MAPTENPHRHEPGPRMAHPSGVICLLAGTYLFLSPWIYGAYTSATAWNSWVVGALIVALSIVRLRQPVGETWLNWFICLLALWTVASPWFYGYTHTTARAISSVLTGAIAFIAGVMNANSAYLQAHRLHGA